VLLRFAAEAGLVSILHNDVYPAHIAPAGMILDLTPEWTHAPGLIRLCRAVPDATVIWAHTGLGRFVKPSLLHLETVSEVLDACPAWNVDLSWDVVQEYLVHPGPGMPSLEAWAAFVARYQDRVLWGSDAVAFTRNRVDGEGRAQMGAPLPVAEYRPLP
jgi:hypothetical protein